MPDFRYWMFRPETLTYELRVRFPNQKEDDVSQVILKLYREDALALVEYIKKGKGDNLMEPLRDTGANFIKVKDGESVILSEESVKNEEANITGGTVFENLDRAERALDRIDKYVETLLKQCGIIMDEHPLFCVGESCMLAIMAVNVARWLENIEKRLQLALEKLGV